MKDCTEQFRRYRDLARTIWNLGFWPDPGLRDHSAIALYEETCARLFEAIVVLSLGYEGHVTNPSLLGENFEFQIIVDRMGDGWRVASAPSEFLGTVWTLSKIELRPKSYDFQFLGFFDWDHQSPKDLKYFRFLIRRLDADPSLQGRHALCEASECSVIFAEPGQ